MRWNFEGIRIQLRNLDATLTSPFLHSLLQFKSRHLWNGWALLHLCTWEEQRRPWQKEIIKSPESWMNQLKAQVPGVILNLFHFSMYILLHIMQYYAYVQYLVRYFPISVNLRKRSKWNKVGAGPRNGLHHPGASWKWNWLESQQRNSLQPHWQ